MAYRNLLDFVQRLRHEGELQEIVPSVSLDGDMAILAQRVSQRSGKALLFHHPQNSDIPTLFNAFASERRMSLALGAEPSVIAERLNGAPVSTANTGSFWSRATSLFQAARFQDFSPRRAQSARCKDLVFRDSSASFESLPIPIAWNDEGRPAITLGQVHCADCHTGERNVGIYRVHVIDGNRAEIQWRGGRGAADLFRGYLQANRRMPIAIVLGDDPAVTFAAYAPTPPDVDELQFAGILRGSAVETIPCESVELEVPAQAEIVLEGFIDPMDFGDSPEAARPLFHLTCITRARDAIFPATAWGGPCPELAYLRLYADRALLPLYRQACPEIVALQRPVECGARSVVIVSIKKTYPGQAYKVAHNLWGTGLFAFCPGILVVDEEVDVSRYDEVIWRTLERFDPERGAQIVKGPVETPGLDAAPPRLGAKMVIDATVPLPGEIGGDESALFHSLSLDALRKADSLIQELGLNADESAIEANRLPSLPESVL